jgi:hypothetical protein
MKYKYMKRVFIIILTQNCQTRKKKWKFSLRRQWQINLVTHKLSSQTGWLFYAWVGSLFRDTLNWSDSIYQNFKNVYVLWSYSSSSRVINGYTCTCLCMQIRMCAAASFNSKKQSKYSGPITLNMVGLCLHLHRKVL